MGAHRFRTRHLGRLHSACIIALACLFALGPAWSANAVPTTPQIEAKRREVAAAQRSMEDLAADLEMRNEEYEQLNVALAETRGQLERTRTAELGHLVVGDDDVEVRLEPAEIFRFVFHPVPVRIKAGAAQLTQNEFGVVGIVLDNQDPQWLLAHNPTVWAAG